ncbi:class I SAM-dependent methyltransferase [uncultured Roseobacter sp.]|uniref:class I SAM-dependent methyltransferase n=1 Tax=uncultured Roseobacter sp. TaxID=114847 RepID=UPI00262E47E8|nr:class I SAM-dependent methyltransferase [uncultured Roseobacter sp.]
MTQTAFWDRIAPKYARQPIRDVESYEYTLGRTRSYLGPQDRVLELGCGTGATAILLAESVARYTATDVSAGMIAEAQVRQSPDTLDFVTAAWSSPRLLDREYDAVLALNLLHLLPDLATVLRRVHTLLEPGGLFISKTTVAPAGRAPLWFPLLRAALPVLRLFGRVPWVAFRPAAEHDALIEAAGFRIVETFDGTGQIPSRYIVARKI